MTADTTASARGRKPLAPRKIEHIELDDDKIATATEAMREKSRERALAVSQHESVVRAEAAKVGYALPADCVDPDLIQRDITANMHRTVQACLDIGRALLVLKAACLHGDFMDRVSALGMEYRMAAAFMQMAAKASRITLPKEALAQIGNQTKLLELLVLDDQQFENLVVTGKTGDLALDDIATMSAKELRTKLRETREDVVAKDELLKNKNAQIDDLRMKVRRVQKAPPNEALQQLQREATEHMNDALGCIHGALRAALRALSETPDELGDQSVFAAGLVGQIVGALADLRYEFNLPDVSNAADLKLAAEIEQWNVPTPAEIAAQQADAKTEA